MNLKTEILEKLKDCNKTFGDIKEFYIRYTSFKDENGNWINWQNRKTRTFFGMI